MMKTMFKMTMGLGVMALAAQQANAQAQPRNCAPRDVVLKHLTEKYGEARRGIGLVQQGSVMEVFASDETRTWTIVVTLPNGMTCLVASGEAYEALAEALPATSNDA